MEVSANVYHREPYVDSVAAANTSIVAGLPPIPRNTVFGYPTADPFDAPGYTLADLRVDWHHVLDSRVGLAAAVTNVANAIYRVSSASAFEVIGDLYSLTGEPRMWSLQIRYDF